MTITICVYVIFRHSSLDCTNIYIYIYIQILLPPWYNCFLYIATATKLVRSTLTGHMGGLNFAFSVVSLMVF